MTPPETLNSLLTLQAAFCRWHCCAALCLDFLTTANADQRSLHGQRLTRGPDAGFAFLFGAQISQFMGEIADLHSARPIHFASPSLMVWPPI